MIGIIGAMQMEVEALIAAMERHQTKSVGKIVFHYGTLDGREVVVCQCGIGKVAAAVTAQAMILEFHPTLILNTGVAGSLCSELDVGDLAISTFAVEYDMDTTPLGDPIGFLSGINVVRLNADAAAAEKLFGLAKKLGQHAIFGGVASADRFVASVEGKNAILKDFPDAVVCEMEGGAIAHACYLNNTPFVVVRAVSDRADGTSHIDFPTFAAAAAQASVRLVRSFLA